VVIALAFGPRHSSVSELELGQTRRPRRKLKRGSRTRPKRTTSRPALNCLIFGLAHSDHITPAVVVILLFPSPSQPPTASLRLLPVRRWTTYLRAALVPGPCDPFLILPVAHNLDACETLHIAAPRPRHFARTCLLVLTASAWNVVCASSVLRGLLSRTAVPPAPFSSHAPFPRLRAL